MSAHFRLVHALVLPLRTGLGGVAGTITVSRKELHGRDWTGWGNRVRSTGNRGEKGIAAVGEKSYG